MPKHQPDPRPKHPADPHLGHLISHKDSLEKTRSKLQQRLDSIEGRIKDAARKIKVYRRKSHIHLGEIVGFDGTPVFRLQALMLKDCREHGWTGTLASGIRWDPPARKFGKKSQQVLYDCYRNCVASCGGDCLPANPPTQGTHLLLGDGVFKGIPAGEKLPKNDLGLDVSEWDQLMAVARKLGYDLRQPYSSASEAHHVNAYNDIEKVLRKRGIIV